MIDIVEAAQQTVAEGVESAEQQDILCRLGCQLGQGRLFGAPMTATAFGEALRPEYKSYIAAVVENAKVLAATLKERGADLVSGGTDTHLALVDLTPLGVTGKDADEALERAGITCNKNGIPNDPLPPVKTSGIRVGSPAGTTRGFGPAEFREIGHMVADVLDGLARKGEHGDPEVEANVRERVRTLCARFPIYEG